MKITLCGSIAFLDEMQLEMGLAFHLGKKIFLLNPIPDISYQEEMFGIRPTVLSGDFGLIV